jgi:type II secretory pathway pseudopilin PulG
METVIAILVLAVLLTGFLTVFTPAAQGIRRSISTQQADRLKATLERDMATLRNNESTEAIPTGFDKAFTWIKQGNDATKAIFIYQYRAWNPASTLDDDNRPKPDDNPRDDGTLYPMTKIVGKPGIDYIIQTAARRKNDPFLLGVDPDDKDDKNVDLKAIVGPLFYVIPTQLVMTNNELVLGTPGLIKNPLPIIAPNKEIADSPEDYTDAVITFSAAFHMVPSVSANYLTGSKFKQKFDYAAAANSKVKPVFVRNLAVRR